MSAKDAPAFAKRSDEWEQAPYFVDPASSEACFLFADPLPFHSEDVEARIELHGTAVKVTVYKPCPLGAEEWPEFQRWLFVPPSLSRSWANVGEGVAMGREYLPLLPAEIVALMPAPAEEIKGWV